MPRRSGRRPARPARTAPGVRALASGAGTPADAEAVAPFFYGRWDTAAREHPALGRPTNDEAVALFGAGDAFTPSATRTALAALRSPVLLLTGEFDLKSPPGPSAEVSALFPDATLAVQPSAGHYPWLDDPAGFVSATADFLA